VKGTKTAFNVRALARALPKAPHPPPPPPPLEAPPVGPGGPLYADPSLCLQHAAKAFLRPSEEEMKEVVMYGELCQVRPCIYRAHQTKR